MAGIDALSLFTLRHDRGLLLGPGTGSKSQQAHNGCQAYQGCQILHSCLRFKTVPAPGLRSGDTSAQSYQFLSAGGMDGHGIIKIPFAGSHAHGDGKALQHFIGARPQHMAAHNPL